MKYRKKPVGIEAFQWKGIEHLADAPEWFQKELQMGCVREESNMLKINTLEGIMTAKTGDFIIRGVLGEIYPCKPNIFMATYEEVT